MPGLRGPTDLAVTGDGRSVYVISEDATLVSFDRSRRSGQLSFGGCLVNFRGYPAPGCTEIKAFGDDPTSLVASADGRSLYVSGSACLGQFAVQACFPRLATFRRNPRSRALTFVRRIRTPGEDLRSLAISPDGRSLYGTYPDFGLLIRVDRNPRTGRIRYRSCRAATANDADAFGCRLRQMGQAGAVAVSPDGRSVVVASGENDLGIPEPDGGIAVFDRAGNGDLSFRGCLRQARGSDQPGCRRAPGVGLSAPYAVGFSPDGRSVYLAVLFDGGSLIRFKRDPRTGEVAFAQCFDASKKKRRRCPGLAPLRGVTSTAPSPDGRHLHVTAGWSGKRNALLRFAVADGRR